MRTRVGIGITACVLVAVGGPSAKAGRAMAAGPATRPAIEAANYGQRLAVPGAVGVWWCDATRKVGRTRPAPEAKGDAVRIEAAQNDFEAAQVVIRPAQALSGLKCTVGDLVRPAGKRIGRGEIDVLRRAHGT